jgi:hypothetical protein
VVYTEMLPAISARRKSSTWGYLINYSRRKKP